MKHASGTWRVVRDCCTSGNCFTCLGKGKVSVVQGDHYTEEYARYVARNWGAYKAVAEPMPIEVPAP